MSGRDRPVVGQIFYVPLYEGGYAFGYVTLIDKQAGIIVNLFDLVCDMNDVPANISAVPIVLRDMLVSGAEFSRLKEMPDKQWKLTPHHMPNDVHPDVALFIMRSRPVYQLIDLANGRSKRPATEEEIARYPVLSTKFPPFTTKIVEKAVRHLDIDPKLIGVDRAAGTVH
ncbi:hypothetical protein [Sphingomonas sp. Leaf23]|uniref:hypothetical protein n=1 Tax=Sphingomonas sp. Leaf23 TaxID=1735689 RepID=UPI000A4C40B3|nr:hypothetical protein [Sphingomonas sp. Leaf23]